MIGDGTARLPPLSDDCPSGENLERAVDSGTVDAPRGENHRHLIGGEVLMVTGKNLEYRAARLRQSLSRLLQSSHGKRKGLFRSMMQIPVACRDTGVHTSWCHGAHGL